MDTTAIIQFIGIVLFSSAVPGDPGVHAILPRIDQGVHTQMNHGDGSDPKKSTTTDVRSHGVEDHVAVIFYRKEDVLARSGDFASEGTLRSRWAYVELDGEQVQFLTNAENSVPTIPKNLPRAAARTEDCPDPRLADTSADVFTADFHGPAYSGAQAVVDIPFGALDVCAKKTEEEAEAVVRVDTTLLLKTDGVLIITAKSQHESEAKTITLDGDAIVYVANVPPHFVFTGAASEEMSEPHWQAYSTMIRTSCSEPAPPEEPQVEATCDLSEINKAWKEAQHNPPTPVLMMVNSECSNSQWP